ncbi:methyltransferase type 11 [Leptolyngbya valderiana BDU 20041]|nr:methyltransferase type 11 [Leptolyngbya valderiana BDU 20041]
MACFNKVFKQIAIALLLLPIALNLVSCSRIPLGTVTQDGVYEYRSLHSPDGIGKFYRGREIAKVMGHSELLWLERSDRQRQERPDRAIEALNLQPDDIVADIGAGIGYFSFRIAKQVPEGLVYAVDVQPEMLDVLRFLKSENGVENVKPILGTATHPNLPEASIDVALMVDAYHEFEWPREMMERVVKSIAPDGRVVLLEYRGENPLIPIKRLHKMTQKQVKREMAAVGLQWRETFDGLPNQHLMVFSRPNAVANPNFVKE